MEFKDFLNVFKKKAVPVAATVGIAAAGTAGVQAQAPGQPEPAPVQPPAVSEQSENPASFQQNPIISNGAEVNFPSPAAPVVKAETPVTSPSPEPVSPSPSLIPPVEQTPIPSPEPSFAPPTLIPPAEQTPQPTLPATDTESITQTPQSSTPAEAPKP